MSECEVDQEAIENLKSQDISFKKISCDKPVPIAFKKASFAANLLA